MYRGACQGCSGVNGDVNIRPSGNFGGGMAGRSRHPHHSSQPYQTMHSSFVGNSIFEYALCIDWVWPSKDATTVLPPRLKERSVTQW